MKKQIILLAAGAALAQPDRCAHLVVRVHGALIEAPAIATRGGDGVGSIDGDGGGTISGQEFYQGLAEDTQHALQVVHRLHAHLRGVATQAPSSQGLRRRNCHLRR